VLEQQGSEEAAIYWRRACDTLTTLVDNGAFVSPQDMPFLERLRTKLND
jgi:hypothetical protein